MRPAYVLAAMILSAASSPARGEPLDVDLTRIGPPDADVWTSVAPALTQEQAAQLAKESRQRFAILSAEMALALSSAVLQPASTTGHSGFAADLEVAAAGVEGGTIGAPTPADFTNRTWATAESDPGTLYLPAVHVRKALPWSFELGGRVIYLARSSYYAAQGEAKWALNEGFRLLPDVAVRAAYTRLFGHEDWNLGTTDLDLLISKRWGLRGLLSLTPYVAARLARVSASTGRMEFARSRTEPPSFDPVELGSTHARFPAFAAWLYRTTLGVRFTTYAVSLALEGTYFGGASPSSSGYDDVEIDSSFGGAAKLGWEF